MVGVEEGRFIVWEGAPLCTCAKILIDSSGARGGIGEQRLNTLESVVTLSSSMDGGVDGGDGLGNDSRPCSLLPLNPVLDQTHIVLLHRRYSPCISDFKCVLSVPNMVQLFSSLPSYSPCLEKDCPVGSTAMVPSLFTKGRGGRCSLDAWIESLLLGQNIDGQRWRSAKRNTVETEPKGSVGACNASISLESLFEQLFNWKDNNQVPITETPKTSICPNNLFSTVDLTHYVLTGGLVIYQQREMSHRTSTLPPRPEPQLITNQPLPHHT